MHRVGWLMAAVILLQIPYRIYGLARRDPSPLGRVVPAVVAYGLIAALIGNWIWKLIP